MSFLRVKLDSLDVHPLGSIKNHQTRVVTSGQPPLYREVGWLLEPAKSTHIAFCRTKECSIVHSFKQSPQAKQHEHVQSDKLSHCDFHSDSLCSTCFLACISSDEHPSIVFVFESNLQSTAWKTSPRSCTDGSCTVDVWHFRAFHAGATQSSRDIAKANAGHWPVIDSDTPTAPHSFWISLLLDKL